MNVSLLIICALVALTTLLAGTLILLLNRRQVRQLHNELRDETEQSLAEFLIYMSAGRLWLISALILTPPALFIGLWWDLTAALAGLVVFAVAIPWLRRWLLIQRYKRIGVQLPDCLHMVSNAMASGLSLLPALELTASQLQRPLRSEFILLVHRLKLGDALSQALADFYRRVPTEAVQFFSLTLTLGMQHGGQQVAVLQRMATALQQQLYARQRLQSLSAQARMQGKVMFLLPVGLFFILQRLHPGNTELLTGTERGQIILGICLVLMLMGHLLIRRIMGTGRYD